MDGAFPRLRENQMAPLAAGGERRRTPGLYCEGDQLRLFLIVGGRVATIDGTAATSSSALSMDPRASWASLACSTASPALSPRRPRGGDVISVPVGCGKRRARSPISVE